MSGMVVGKRGEGGRIDKELFSPESLRGNAVALMSGRTITALAGGACSGVLGLTGLQGILCFFLYMALFSCCMMFKLKFQYKMYFASWRQLCVDGVLNSITTYILFWTLAYNSVHIF